MTHSLGSSTSVNFVHTHNSNAIRPPVLTPTSIKNYLCTRFSSLFVPKEERSQYTWAQVLNPFGELKHMTLRNWNFFLMGFAAWTCDSMDYVAVNLNTSNLATSLGVSIKDITWGITLVLMFRPVGALIFGYWGDRFGRKWPYVINLCCLVVLLIGTGFIQTYQQFLVVRSLFGIAMGGVFGFSLATSLEDSPNQCRDAHAEKEMKAHLKWYQISHRTKNVLRTYWLTVVYCIFLMSGFTFMSHGSQDLYPTLLEKQLGFSANQSMVTNCVAYLGAIVGGIVCGHSSTFMGRRLIVILAVLLGAAMIYPWAYLKGPAINAGAFFMQAGVQGAWGVIPIHLSELSPPAYRSLVVGLSYQLGNLVSSASSTIESTVGEDFPIITATGEAGYDYSKVMSIFIGCVFGYVLFITFVGPENRGAGFEVDRDTILGEELGGRGEVEEDLVKTKEILVHKV
ncbi:hypothetical protein JCM33374_g1044 [Metschnikowia sp. JCM 33374]|nr:hypothetical protein JCM33374_g1044 [Metschnikowia sp. JCM 33374]